MEDLPRVPGDAVVHAYTPWHTAMFYFYGWLPGQMCLSLMSVVFGLCLFFIVHECVRIAKAHLEHYGLAVGLSLAIISYFIAQCFVFLNYGILILAAFLLMNRALEKGHDVAAGLCWAVMMIKPQVGLLFVWPLFWHHHYRTIVTATAVCLVATFFTSLRVHESMIDLILQIPQIGKPYGLGGDILGMITTPRIGETVAFLLMPLGFALTGVATWFLRRRNDFIFSCVPVVLAIPVWTYSQSHDHVILLPFFLFLADAVFSTRNPNHRWAAWICICYCATLAFTGMWSFVTYFGWFDPSGRGWIYRLVSSASHPLLLLYLVFLIREELQRRRHAVLG